jgi:hypothetical protein
MARSTGPIVATGAIAYANQVIGNGKSWTAELRIPVATAIAAGFLTLLEHASPELAVGIAWIALITSLVAPLGGGNAAVTNLLRLTGLGGKQ